jgi:hypothetical protein
VKPAQEPKRAQSSDPKPVEKTDRATTPAEDPAKVREQIAKDMQSAEQKLKASDPGPTTQQLQQRALRNIDKLIELIRNPPPPPPMSDPPPMGGDPPPAGGDQSLPKGQPGSQSLPQTQTGSQPQGGSQSQPQGGGLSRREQREQRRRQQQQQARGGGQPRPAPGGATQPQPDPDPAQAGLPLNGGGGRPGPNGQPDKLADMVKDIWGHLPETLRQEVDHYYRDQFMPRYRELLQQYYTRLAERERNRGRDR